MQTGTRLGPYEVTAQLGAGGMGEVYRARDSRLDRTVAIKILPQRFSSDERLRERFEREARAISALTHPNICTLYDIGQHEGASFLVMEYVDGESLADRLAKGPLPIDQVIRYGVEIAEALEKAHRAGIVHRDLKPGNIILTKSGAKLLDFGLAKFSQMNQPSDPNAATAAMQQKPLTEEGAILGTFQYMAPEQIEGRDADARTDIFALGAVLYEMATAKRAFEAKSKASLIASILDREPPPISTVQPLTPPAFERVVQLCLAKDPDERWQSAHDVAAELRWIRDTSSESIGPAAKRSRWKRIGRSAALALAGLAIGALATWLLMRGRTAPRATARYSITTPQQAPLNLGYGSMAISPDGTRVVYVAREAPSQYRLYMRTSSSPVARPITGTENGYSPAFSPDGKWIAFLAQGGLFKVPVDGGMPVKLQDRASGGLGVHWFGDTIYFTRFFTSGIEAIRAGGGTADEVVKVDPAKGVRSASWPHVLPGGEHVLATVWNNGMWEDAKIVAYSLRDGSSKVIIEGGSAARYVPSGHLVFGRGPSIMAVAFDPKSLEVSGTPVAVVNGVAWDSLTGAPQFAVSESGDLLYAAGGTIDESKTLLAVDRAGKETPIIATRRPYGDPTMSADGRYLAVTIEGATFDVWLVDVERELMTRVSFGGDDLDGVITADGSYIYWMSSRTGRYNIYRARTDGSGGEERVLSSDRDQFIGTIAPDHSFLVIAEAKTRSNVDIYVVPLNTRKKRALVATPYSEYPNHVSPDGKWLSYVSEESGRRELYVRAIDGSPMKWQISVGGAGGGGFTPDGRTILYRNGAKFYAVPIETAPRFRASKPVLLFEKTTYDNDWSITNDGRFLVMQAGPPPLTTQMQIVLNWSEELKRRAPVN
jgi:eukaryotic-like serine/threonine-protein kinase